MHSACSWILFIEAKCFVGVFRRSEYVRRQQSWMLFISYQVYNKQQHPRLSTPTHLSNGMVNPPLLRTLAIATIAMQIHTNATKPIHASIFVPPMPDSTTEAKLLIPHSTQMQQASPHPSYPCNRIILCTLQEDRYMFYNRDHLLFDANAQTRCVMQEKKVREEEKKRERGRRNLVEGERRGEYQSALKLQTQQHIRSSSLDHTTRQLLIRTLLIPDSIKETPAMAWQTRRSDLLTCLILSFLISLLRRVQVLISWWGRSGIAVRGRRGRGRHRFCLTSLLSRCLLQSDVGDGGCA